MSVPWRHIGTTIIHLMMNRSQRDRYAANFINSTVAKSEKLKGYQILEICEWHEAHNSYHFGVKAIKDGADGPEYITDSVFKDGYPEEDYLKMKDGVDITW